MLSSTKTPTARLHARLYTLIRAIQTPELIFRVIENKPLTLVQPCKLHEFITS
jgi:hypothetical protein